MWERAGRVVADDNVVDGVADVSDAAAFRDYWHEREDVVPEQVVDDIVRRNLVKKVDGHAVLERVGCEGEELREWREGLEKDGGDVVEGLVFGDNALGERKEREDCGGQKGVEQVL